MTTSRKMTDEDTARMFARHESRLLSEDESRLWAHVAALTAERDMQVRQLESESAKVLRLEEEAVALRERVQALEAEAADVGGSRTRWQRRAETAEALLAAIRQRAGDVDGLGMACAEGVAAGRWDATHDAEDRDAFRDMGESVARYLLGEDATGAEADAGTAHRDRMEAALAETSDAGGLAPEPATAEAFATVRKSMEACGAVHDVAGCMLAQLERRMGAMGRALEGLRAAHMAGGNLSVMWPLWRWVDDALTDAPPVFTLEEVGEAIRHAVGGSLVSADVVMRRVSKCLAALRKVTL